MSMVVVHRIIQCLLISVQIDWHQRPSAKDLLQDPFIQRYNPTPGLDTVVQGTATLDTTTLYTEQQCEDQSDDRLPDNEGENRTPPADTAASQVCTYICTMCICSIYAYYVLYVKFYK